MWAKVEKDKALVAGALWVFMQQTLVEWSYQLRMYCGNEKSMLVGALVNAGKNNKLIKPAAKLKYKLTSYK